MADRERKRAARQKRKTRSAERVAAEEAEGTAPEPAEPAPKQTRAERKQAYAERQARMREKTEAKNAAARGELEPLEAGERPRIVTIAAVISALFAIASIAGWVLWDQLRDDPQPSLGRVIPFTIIVSVMAWGLWRARYWAVLGFQAALALVAVISGLGLVGSVTVPLLLGNLVLLVASGILFFFMIKAMARIQMPERREPRS